MSINAIGITVLDVGHGNSAVVLDTGGAAVIDAGPGDTLRRHLMDQGIREIDVLFISHADADHLRGVIHLLANPDFRIRKILVNPDAAKGSKLWDDVVYELNQRDIAGNVELITMLVRDLTGSHDVGSMRIEVLGPSKYLAAKGSGGRDRDGRSITSNALSATIRIVSEGKPILLLPGDIDSVGLKDLEDAQVDARAQAIIWPHHGGRTGADDEDFVRRLLKLVQPSVILFSIGRGQHATPQPEVIAAIRRQAPIAEIRCTQLSAHCQARLVTSSVAHLANIEARGRERKTCCGGSIWIDAKAGQFAPSASSHQAFISAFATTPLCRMTGAR